MSKLLVIDTSNEIFTLYETVLMPHHVGVISAMTSEQALAALDKHNDIAAIVTASRLQGGSLSPVDLVPYLVERFKGPVIASTGGDTIAERALMEAGCTHAAPKPEALTRVLDILESYGVITRLSR